MRRPAQPPVPQERRRVRARARAAAEPRGRDARRAGRRRRRGRRGIARLSRRARKGDPDDRVRRRRAPPGARARRSAESQAAKAAIASRASRRFMAQRLRTDHDYQTLIIPYLLLRNARSGSNECRWHGVRRPVEKSGSGFDEGGPARLVRADIRAASLKVFAFSADGERVFEGVGGLDLVDRVSADDERALLHGGPRGRARRSGDAPRGRRARARAAGAPRAVGWAKAAGSCVTRASPRGLCPPYRYRSINLTISTALSRSGFSPAIMSAYRNDSRDPNQGVGHRVRVDRQVQRAALDLLFEVWTIGASDSFGLDRWAEAAMPRAHRGAALMFAYYAAEASSRSRGRFFAAIPDCAHEPCRTDLRGRVARVRMRRLTLSPVS